MLGKPVDLYTEVFFFFLQLVFILEQLHAITSVPPETPHEKWFQEKFGKFHSKFHSRILYPVRREMFQKFLLVQNASWAVELLGLSRNIPLFGQAKFCMHRDRPSESIFSQLIPAYISTVHFTYIL